MKKVFIALKPFNNKIYYNNAIFNEHSPTGSNYLIAARKLFKKSNIIMNTIDTFTNIPTLKDIYMDIPYPWELILWIRIVKNSKKNILFMGEPPIVNPFNHMRILHFFFSKIYSWNSSIVDNIRYFKYYLPVSTRDIGTNPVSFNNKKLLIMMNMNWLPFLPFKLLSLSTKELYTERVKALDFFDKFYPYDFCLYGRGWNKPQRFSVIQKIFGCKKYKTYKGEFAQNDKYKILSRFKFSLCFENCEIPGNISEKIFDCFKAGCVPIYWGAPDITNYISNKCFIDYRKFKNYKDLANFLKTIDEKSYNNYIREINKFILSKQFLEVWSEKAFAKIFEKAIT